MYIYLFTIKYNVRDTFTADIFAGVTSNINDDPNLKMSAVKNDYTVLWFILTALTRMLTFAKSFTNMVTTVYVIGINVG